MFFDKHSIFEKFFFIFMHHQQTMKEDNLIDFFFHSLFRINFNIPVNNESIQHANVKKENRLRKF